MPITIRLGDENARTVLTRTELGLPPNPLVQGILDKHAGEGEGSVAEVLGNRFERTELLKELALVGMEGWLKSGSKARFEQLVKQAISRPFDGYITDYGRWEREYGQQKEQEVPE
ncbi:hypothetical protein [Pseudomonas serbica]|uniref:hypothetical protein n=1 Tax=Pseudomonas serbica TaxID=2965074 RepID=UPI00237A494C|nr:hypothetical protein [Pseudomonas serbica]